MRYLDEFRGPEQIAALLREIRRITRRPFRFMEVCGTHTMAIARWGLKRLLPEEIELVSGPGCPVCVTANPDIDRAIALADIPEAIIATFGDLMRVPGSLSSLSGQRARGRDIRVVYSPLDALFLAEEFPKNKVIFIAVGFETTAPTLAATIKEAYVRGLANFYALSLHKTVPPALATLLDLGEIKLDGFILPGHVSAVIGSKPYEFIPKDHGLGCVITGFEPADILQAILLLVRQANALAPRVEIQYRRGVNPAGNRIAREIMAEVFAPAPGLWRGLGMIPESGLELRDRWASFDGGRTFPVELPQAKESPGCHCGEVLRGLISPRECPLYGRLCTPEEPHGPCMVSTEGSCAAAWKEEI